MFKKFNNFKLRTKLLLSICSVAWLAFAVTIFYIGYNAKSLAEAEALDKARESAYRYANLVKAELGKSMATQAPRSWGRVCTTRRWRCAPTTAP